MEITIEGVDTIVADFGDKPKQIDRAHVRALNRSIGSGRTLMVQLMSRDMGLKSKDIRDAMPIREASLGRPEASFGAKLKRIGLAKFGARQTRRGVSVNVGGRRVIAGAFMATMPSGHVGVFKRVPGASRRGPAPHRSQLPITELFGPSLGQVFRKFRPQGIQRTLDAYETNFDHELKFATGQTGAPDAGGSD